MRNAMALSVSQNRLNAILRYFELFRDFGHAQAMLEVIHNRADRHPRTAEYRRTALYARIDIKQRA